MSINLEDLDKMIEDAEKELEGLKAVRRRQAGIPTIVESVSTTSLNDTGTINLDDLDIPVKAIKSGNSLQTNVESLIKRFDDQEFTVTHVDVALKKIGKGSKAKHFKNRISIAIRKLTEDGVLERTYKGKGSDPHRYRLKSSKFSFVKSSPVEVR